MKIVYHFGEEYYWRSNTFMGALYTDKGERYDWGFLQRDVRNGEEVLVRPATPEMLAWADEHLKEYQS